MFRQPVRQAMEKSIMDDEIETLSKVQTIADGIAVKTPGDLTFDLVKEYVDGIYTVTDDEIALDILTLLSSRSLFRRGGRCSCCSSSGRKNPR